MAGILSINHAMQPKMPHDYTQVRYGPIASKLKRSKEPGTDHRLTAVLADLVFQVLALVERMNPVPVMRIEQALGETFLRDRYRILVTNLRDRLHAHRHVMESCVTELAWCLDNFRTLPAEHISLSSDTMNGFFVGPKSAASILDALLRWACLTPLNTDNCKFARERLLTAIKAFHFERHDRLIGQTALIAKTLAEAERLITNANPGAYRYEALAKKLPYPTLELECKQALILVVAARMGLEVRGEDQLAEVCAILRRGDTVRTDIVILGPGITPRRLWDCLLPYVSVHSTNRTLRGTIDQADWLVTYTYTGEGVGLHRRYRDVVGKEATTGGCGVVREGYRPNVGVLRPSEVATIQWMLEPANPLLQELYHGLRVAAEMGHGPRSRKCAQIWMRAYDVIRMQDAMFADGHFTNSVSLGAASLIAAASDSIEIFREGILVRFIGTLSCEGCLIETREGGTLRIDKDTEGVVNLTAPENIVRGFLVLLAQRIDEHCRSRGIAVRSSLSCGISNAIVPSFVGKADVEAYTPAIWINLTRIDTPREPTGQG